MNLIKQTIGTLFNNGKILCIFLCGIFLINILPLPCFGIKAGYAEPVFSISATNELLCDVLAKISKTTGYKIEIDKGLKNKSLTVNLNKFTIVGGIREIFRIIDEPNYAIVIDDSMKKVEIKVFDASSGNSSFRIDNPAEHLQRQNEDDGTKTSFSDNEVMQPTPDITMPPDVRTNSPEVRQQPSGMVLP